MLFSVRTLALLLTTAVIVVSTLPATLGGASRAPAIDDSPAIAALVPTSAYGGTPRAIPGLVEAEDFDEGGQSVAFYDTTTGNAGNAYRQSDVDIQPTTDTGGGFNVGWMAGGEWLVYTVDVALPGAYRLDLRVAAPGAGGRVHVEFEGSDKTGPMTIPDTGSWQSWATISAPVTLSSGTQRMRIVVEAASASGTVGNLNSIQLVSTGSTPFGGTPYVLPGLVQAENFDNGEANAAYVDSTAGNLGGAYRATDVDLQATTDTGGGYNVGWMSRGEWLSYVVQVAAAGSYGLDLRVASSGPGGRLHVEFDGVDKTGPLTIPDTGGWQKWTTIRAPVSLVTGAQRMRVVIDAASAIGVVGNLNYIQLTAISLSTPFTAMPIALPGVVQAEDFDDGGANVAYRDLTPGNDGGAYRSTDVDIQLTSDAGGGYNIGWMLPAEWLTYSVTAAAAGSYRVGLRVAADGEGGRLHVEFDGIDKTGPLSVPNTGGWQKWTTITAPVTLRAGAQRMRVVVDGAGAKGVVGNLNYIEVLAAEPPTPQNIVIYATDIPPAALHGSWSKAPDPSSPGGVRLQTSDVQWSTTNAPLAAPVHYVDVSFSAMADTPYAVWLRLKALEESKYNDSVWVQFSAARVAGADVYALDTTSALLINLATDSSGSSLDGWGWQNGAYWLKQSSTVTFSATGPQTMRISVREDGVQLDQIVLSPTTYSTTAPGPASGDQTIVLKPDSDENPPPPPLNVTSPAPGTVLRSNAVTFQWQGEGDEFWLNIGTTPGSADVYGSGSLTHTTEHTVSGLPLNGAPLYVQLRRRLGTSTDSVSASYTAPVRKGLLVITDFANRRLEDWTGEGMNSVQDVSYQLDLMEAHWAWLSRGGENFRWDIIRIQLPVSAVPDAYSGWGEFRDAAVTLARQQVQTVDYDVNGDNVIDAVWLIVSNGEDPVPFALGGMSRNAGANLFVDGQASGSVKAQATGNFTHELGHCLGLPDMYGTYATMNSLTVMSDSWALPPQDFAAYERLRLGWLEPRVITATTQGVWLPSAHDAFAAVLVPTARASEYFLIEYRRRPDTGYGSSGPRINGLAVYHVLEGTSMWVNPPVVKLEPADGSIIPSSPTDLNDFLFPENTALLRPVVLQSYFGAEEVLRIDNVRWSDTGILFDVAIPEMTTPLNLVANGSFESGQGELPDGWIPPSGSGVTAFWPSVVALEGNNSAFVALATPGRSGWTQRVTGLTPWSGYRLCGWMKGENVRIEELGGAVIASPNGDFTLESEGLGGTFDWTNRCATLNTPWTEITVGCGLGTSRGASSGKLWCDGLTLEPRPGPAFK